jgi:hypothetical protein
MMSYRLCKGYTGLITEKISLTGAACSTGIFFQSRLFAANGWEVNYTFCSGVRLLVQTGLLVQSHLVYYKGSIRLIEACASYRPRRHELPAYFTSITRSSVRWYNTTRFVSPVVVLTTRRSGLAM